MAPPQLDQKHGRHHDVELPAPSETFTIVSTAGDLRAVWRAVQEALVVRIGITVATVVAVIALTGVAPWVTLAVTVGGVVAIAIWEQLVDRALVV